MGLCVSSQIISSQNGRFLNFPYTVMVIQSNGKLQQFKQPIRAGKLLSQNPSCFICCSETMNVDSFPVQMAEDDELQAGQLYFLMPISKSQTLITLQDLCTLAIKASAAINSDGSERRRAVVASVPFVDEKCAVKFWGRAERASRIPHRDSSRCRGGAIGVNSAFANHVASTN